MYCIRQDPWHSEGKNGKQPLAGRKQQLQGDLCITGLMVVVWDFGTSLDSLLYAICKNEKENMPDYKLLHLSKISSSWYLELRVHYKEKGLGSYIIIVI